MKSTKKTYIGTKQYIGTECKGIQNQKWIWASFDPYMNFHVNNNAQNFEMRQPKGFFDFTKNALSCKFCLLCFVFIQVQRHAVYVRKLAESNWVDRLERWTCPRYVSQTRLPRRPGRVAVRQYHRCIRKQLAYRVIKIHTFLKTLFGLCHFKIMCIVINMKIHV